MAKRKKSKPLSSPKILITPDEPIEETNQIVLYDERQQQKDFFLDIKHVIFTTFSFNALLKIIYYYVIQLETEYFIQDIEKIRKRFNNNLYTRIINEFNLFIVNSMEINSDNCAIFGLSQTLYYSPDMVNDLMNQAHSFDAYINTNFFLQIYTDYVKHYIGIGPSLETLEQFVDVPFEKTYLRGAHSQLTDIREEYNDKMKHYVHFNLTSNNSNNNYAIALELFTDKMTDLLSSPDHLMCNHLISQNNINLKNFKDNFINLNHMTIKDLYNNVLDTTDGIVSMRIQNSIAKSCYITVLLTTGILMYQLYKLCVYYLIGKKPQQKIIT